MPQIFADVINDFIKFLVCKPLGSNSNTASCLWHGSPHNCGFLQDEGFEYASKTRWEEKISIYQLEKYTDLLNLTPYAAAEPLIFRLSTLLGNER